jgi:DNA processing protein
MDVVTPPEDSSLAWLALLRLPGCGPRTLIPLLTACPDAAELLRHPPAQVPDKLRNALRTPDWEQAEKDLRWLLDSGNQLLPLTSPHYPERLGELPDAPLALFLRGDPQWLQAPQIAVVGSRNATRGGLENAHRFSGFLSAAGITICSGLALGIDSAAHEGALQAPGSTVAVLGTGLDRVYPARHRDLAHRIAAQGLLVSEYPPGTPPLPQNFPRRNRIIAGLSLGTLVVEAALQSGSLITARLASELGREVFAIPGSIHNPMARGCHALIRDGAKLVETAEHIAEELASLLGGMPIPDASTHEDQASATGLDPDHVELLECMGFDPVSTDQLVTKSRFSAAEISSMLLLLELQGHVSSESGGLFTRLGNCDT